MELALDKPIGRGMSAQVWKATDSLGRVVAVKFVDPTMPYAHDFALNHAKALARIHCKSVIRVIALERQPHPDTEQDCPVIIMDYVEGQSLAQVSQQEVFSAAQVQRYGTDMIDALDAMHAAGIVHGDLHEGNVLLGADGAVIIDILYTHSLAEISASHQNRQREGDHRDLVRLLRSLLEHTVPPSGSGAFIDALGSQSLSLARIRAHFDRLFSPDSKPSTTTLFVSPWQSLRDVALPFHGRLTQACWAPNGRRLAFWSDQDELRGSVHILNIEKWTDTSSLQVCARDHDVQQVSWSNDGRTIAASGWNQMCVFNVETKTELFRDEMPCIYDQCRLSPDGTRVAWATVFGLVRLRSLVDRTEHSAQFHDGAGSYGTAFLWSPSGARLLVAVERTAVHIWDYQGRFMAGATPILPNFESTGSLLWTDDSSYLASLNAHAELSLMGAGHGWRHGSNVSSIASSPTGRGVPMALCSARTLVAAVAGRNVEVWSPSEMALICSLQLPAQLLDGNVNACSMSPDGKQLAIVTLTDICIYSFDDNVVRQYPTNGTRLVIVGWDDSTALWCFAEIGAIHRIAASTMSTVRCNSRIHQMALAPGAKCATIVSSTGAYLWHFHTHRLSLVSVLVDQHRSASVHVEEVQEAALFDVHDMTKDWLTQNWS
jgi:WD40 repeat protein